MRAVAYGILVPIEYYGGRGPNSIFGLPSHCSALNFPNHYNIQNPLALQAGHVSL